MKAKYQKKIFKEISTERKEIKMMGQNRKKAENWDHQGTIKR